MRLLRNLIPNVVEEIERIPEFQDLEQPAVGELEAEKQKTEDGVSKHIRLFFLILAIGFLIMIVVFVFPLKDKHLKTDSFSGLTPVPTIIQKSESLNGKEKKLEEELIELQQILGSLDLQNGIFTPPVLDLNIKL